MRKTFMSAASAAAILILASGLALAQGGGGSGGGNSGGGSGGSGGSSSGGSSGGNSGAGKSCAAGYVWSKKQKKCVEQSSIDLKDEERIAQGWVFARQGQFEAGRALFSAVANKNNPEVLNGLGYTSRKLGYFTEAIAFYQKALALDPNYAEAREYLGEGYVTMGKFDLANEQLAAIAGICGATCEEYTNLKEFIANAVREARSQ